MLLPHEAIKKLPTHFVFNAMATTSYHDQFMIDIDKKYTILFLYDSASYSCAQLSYTL